MKVYVDELPKDCIDCPCESEYYCNLLNEDVGCLKYGEIHKDCPLQSLSDYIKQVRKEVCEEIRNKLDEISGEHEVKVKGGIGKFTCVPRHTLEELLDQTQGETNE